MVSTSHGEDTVTRKKKILVVDDTPLNVKLLVDLLGFHNYEMVVAASGIEALEQVVKERPDLILLDVVMPGMSGYEVCQKLRDDPETAVLPVIMVTALDPAQERIHGIEAGADDFLIKPVNQAELLARVRSLLRVKELHDTVRSQAAQLSEWNKTLEQRVQEQVSQLDRLGRLKRFFSPQIADLIVASSTGDPLRTHRREVTVVFVDLRGFTSFAETAEPEEVMEVLRDYHAEMGRLIFEHEGTLERFAGDGIMIFFNDPIEVSNHQERAMRMAVAMRHAIDSLRTKWMKQGHDLSAGLGMATGYATIGVIGFEGRWDYSVIGTVPNLAARLCAEAQPGQILVSQRFLSRVEDLVQAELLGEVALKGFKRPISTFNILRLL